MAYLTLLTTLGQAKLATALVNGTGVAISHLAVGDGNGAAVTPQASMTALVREKHRVSVQSVIADPVNPNYIIVEAVIPSTVGGWTIREAGLFDSAGQLFAVANFPDTVKPLLAEGSARDLVIRIVIEVSNTSAVQLLIDPSVVLASQAWVLQQGYVKKSGDTMTGPLVLPGNATQNLQAVPKQQLDAAIAAVDLTSRVAKSGDTMTGLLTLSEDPTLSMHAATKNYVDAARGVDSVPIGEVIWHAGSTPPTSFLVCDGSAVSRTTYDVLFARIGTTYGTGDGSTTFNLPDLRGEFIRGWDNRATGGVDNGRVFGSKQTATGLGHIGTDASSNQLAMSVDNPDLPNETYSFPGRLDSGQAGTATQKRWRVRPRNVAMLPCIKARLLTNVDIALMQQAQAMYVAKAGDTMTGPLVLSGDATQSLHAVTKQQLDSAISSALPAGSVAYVAMSSAPTGFLKANGALVSRSTYAALFAALIKTSAVSISVASPGVITWAAHGRSANEPVKFTTTGALPTGLVAGTTYYVVGSSITTNTFTVSATPGGTAINTSGTQSGTHTAVSAPYGDGDGSTTFNVPDLRGEFIRGWDDGRSVDTNRAFGSSQADDFKSHTHSLYGGEAGSFQQGGAYGASSSSNLTIRGSTVAAGGTETRPRNVSMLAVIKF